MGANGVSTLKLVPKTPTENTADGADAVLATLNKALEITQLDIEADQAPTACVVVFMREYSDGTACASWLTSVGNVFTNLGLLTKAIHDMQSDVVAVFNDGDESGDEGGA